MLTLVSISTCVRPGGVSYLEPTAEALVREGAGECGVRAIFWDGPVQRPTAGWDAIGHAGAPEGSRFNMWRVFRFALERQADRLVYCEDDIVPSKNAIRKICSLEVPEWAAFIDFHDMKELRRAGEPGMHRVPAAGYDRRGYWGTQCMSFPRRTLEWLAQRDPATVARRALPNCADATLGWLLVSSPWPMYAAHLPCLVRHAGAVSAAHPGSTLRRHRLPSHYLGDEVDALALG